MKIALLSCFYPYRGGISQFNTHLFEELGKTDVVRAFNFKRQYPEFLFPGKTQYVSATDTAVSVESTSLLDTVNPFSYVKTLKAIRRWNPDVLIVRYWMSWFAPSLGFITRHMRGRCKVISILDNVIPHERHFFDAPLTRYFLSGSDACVTLCEAVAGDLSRLAPDKPCKVIPHPLYDQFGQKVPREDACRSLGLDPSLKTLLFFGLIRDYKGLDVLIDAFNRLDGTYQLVIAGEPYGSFDRYQAMIDVSPAKDRIHLHLKYVDDEGVADFFSAADLVVLPYRSATQSGINSIALNFGVPLVVTDVGGLRETIGDRGTGLVAKECAPDSVAGEIRRYFDDPQLRDRCLESIEKEKKRLSWDNFRKDLTEFIDKI